MNTFGEKLKGFREKKSSRRNKFGNELKKLREERNLTVNEFAEKTYYDNRVILSYEQGQLRPDVESIACFSLFFHVDAKEWFTLLIDEDEQRRNIKKNYMAVIMVIISFIVTFIVRAFIWEMKVVPLELKLKIIFLRFWIVNPLLSIIFGYLIIYRIQISEVIKRTNNAVVLVIHLFWTFGGILYMTFFIAFFFGIDFHEIARGYTAGADDSLRYIGSVIDFIMVLYGIVFCITAQKEKNIEK